jgi:ribonuclease VapC
MPYALDTSAMLAVVFREAGQDVVHAALRDGAAISAVNFAEAVTRLVRDGMPADRAHLALSSLPIDLRALNEDLAVLTGALYAQTHQFGLSLGDRACLALARQESMIALTGDRIWLRAAPLVGVEVRLIR